MCDKYDINAYSRASGTRKFQLDLGCKLILERISWLNWALGNTDRTIRPVSSLLEKTMPMLGGSGL